MGYSSCLTSILSIQTFSPPFTSLQDMKKSSSFKLIIYSNGNMKNSILAKVYEDQELLKVYKNSIKPYEMASSAAFENHMKLSESSDPGLGLLNHESSFLRYCSRGKFIGL